MRHKKIVLSLILLISFLDWMGIGLVYPMFSSMLFQPDSLLISYESSGGTRGFILGLLLSIAPLTQIISAPVLGAISDLKGRRFIFVISLSIGVLGYILGVLGIFAENLSLLIFSRFIIGISLGSAAVGSAALADISTETDKTKNFGLLSMACGLGFTFGPFLGGQFCQVPLGIFSGYATPFILAGFATLLNLFLVIFLYREKVDKDIKKIQNLNWKVGVTRIINAFRLKELRMLFFCSFLFAFGWSFYWEFIPITWIATYQLSPSEIGAFYAFGAAVYATSSGFLIRPIVARFKGSTILFFALLFSSVSLLGGLLPLSKNEWWLYISLQQFLISFILPTASTIVSDSACDAKQGETLGAFQSIQALAFGLSPLTLGALMGLDPKMPIIIGGLAMLLAALVFGLFNVRLISAINISKQNY